MSNYNIVSGSEGLEDLRHSSEFAALVDEWVNINLRERSITTFNERASSYWISLREFL